jgi:hypothetical protein
MVVNVESWPGVFADAFGDAGAGLLAWPDTSSRTTIAT